MINFKLQLFWIISLSIIASSLLLTPVLSAAQRQNHLTGRFKDGYLRFGFAGQTLTRFEFHRTNSQGNFCDVEVSRSSADSRWTTVKNVTRIEVTENPGSEFKSNGEIVITQLGSQFEVIFKIAETSQICGVGRQLPTRTEVYRTNRHIKVNVIE